MRSPPVVAAIGLAGPAAANTVTFGTPPIGDCAVCAGGDRAAEARISGRAPTAVSIGGVVFLGFVAVIVSD